MVEHLVQGTQARRSCAAALCEGVRELISRTGRARIAMAGGSAASVVGDLRNALGADFSKVHLTWVDERRVSYDDPHSNRGQAYRTGILVPGAHGEELALWQDGDTDATVLHRVNTELDAKFSGALDLCVLGMGEDGHIASLFPDSDHSGADSGAERVLLVDDSPKPPPKRISLSLSFLQQCPRHYLLALGEAKRDALQAVLKGTDHSLAATLPNLQVFTDLTDINP